MPSTTASQQPVSALRSRRHPLPEPTPAACSLPLIEGRELDSWGDPIHPSAVPLLPDVGPVEPQLATRLELSRTGLPEVGETFLGFQLVAELGRGAFGRVFLARQNELAGRLVALKVSTESLTESQKLAQLQHTHIVPIYSFHQAGPIQAVCMPYFGSTTLHDVLHDLQQKKSLPDSGRGLVSTLHERKSRTARSLDSHGSTGSRPTTATPSSLPEIAVPFTGTGGDGLHTLEGFTYVEAILWLGARLADGLAHAHERGILHRDLKPANILLTDDGQPMLLDFNLAEDVKQSGGAAAALIGGTLPYMAPEHLTAFLGGPATVDHRADIYALGLILVELLLGRHPFTRFAGRPDVALPKMIAERNQGAPELRKFNAAVSPATEAILRRCLHPDPAQRYQSARELQEDLDAQLNNQPLPHTPEPSLGERVQKWARQHPRLTSASGLGLLAVVLTTAFLIVLLTFWARLARFQAEETSRALADDLNQTRLRLAVVRLDPDQRAEGRTFARQGLERFGPLEDQPPPLPSSLKEDERKVVEEQLVELLLWLAQTENDPEQALAYNERATRWFGPEVAPRAAALQRANLLRGRGRDEEVAEALRRAGTSPARTAWEQALLAREQLGRDDLAQALRAAAAAVEKDDRNAAAWFLLGNCALEGAPTQLAEDHEPIRAFTVCLSLAGDFYAARFNRGLAYLRLQDYALAERDFTRAIELRPAGAEAYLHRATAREGLGRPDEALQDVERAIAGGFVTHRALLTRARLREAAGDHAGARADRAEALRREPTDEESYIARGAARLAHDAEGALADFRAAVRLNPNSLAGLNNQAHVLADRRNQPREALQLMDLVLTKYPRLAAGFAGRGVLRARLGDDEGAIADAKKALELDPSADIVYQVAGIYAQTSQRTPLDKLQAFRMLAAALARGEGLDMIDHDPDLKPLRNDPRWHEIVGAARTLQRAAGLP